MDKDNIVLIERINSLVDKEIVNNPVSYNKDKSYQSYERINFPGMRWSVEKRILAYKLERLFSNEYSVLDIGSNFGFFVCEFAMNCKLVHGIEPNKYLNAIGLETAKYLKVDNKVDFFNCYFDKFKSEIKYDVILSLASFYTQDKREKGDAEKYFGYIDTYLSEKGYVFYESTSYTKMVDDLHDDARNEAKNVMNEKFDVVEEYETNSGSEGFFRYFILAKKKI